MAYIPNKKDYEILLDDSMQILQSEEILYCHGYVKNYIKTPLFHIFSFIFFGFPYILIYWYPILIPYVKYSSCALNKAEFVLIKDSHSCYTISPVEKNLNYSSQTITIEWIKYFYYKHLKYIWNSQEHLFKRVFGLDDEKHTLNDLLENSHGLNKDIQKNLLVLFDYNEMLIPIRSYFALAFDEVLNPFYLFQMASIILWILDDYFYYAFCVFILSMISVLSSIRQTRKQNIHLRNLVMSTNLLKFKVCRPNGVEDEIFSRYLVPGDVISLPSQGCILPCDVILLSGNCIVNESLLTGESVPVTKIPIQYSNEKYNINYHKQSTLFSGTQLIQTRYYGNNKVLAIVSRTGFSTTKGELVRSILHPRPFSFRFYIDSMKYVGILFLISCFGMAYTIYRYFERGSPWVTITLQALEIVTIVVPPALPAALTAGTTISQNRLEREGITCASPPTINVSGKLSLCCFDKTGTLTEEGLELGCIIPSFREFGKFSFSQPIASNAIESINPHLPFINAMACCHSLNLINEEIHGDPLDMTMFKATQWILDEPGQDPQKYDLLSPTIVKPKTQPEYEIGIIRHFHFSSSLQTMSVIVRILGQNSMSLYTKGAPEKIISLCRSETIPVDFNSVLHYFTSRGYRVLALARKELDIKFSWKQAQRIKRDQIEQELEMLGLLILCNKLKPQSTYVIQTLKDASIRSVMLTGDNLLTSVSVAHDCKMIPLNESIFQLNVEVFSNENLIEPKIQLVPLNIANTGEDLNDFSRLYLALDGATWILLQKYYPAFLPKIVKRVIVFARMTSEQKAEVVRTLQEIGHIVGMCGDGANDCAALKASDVGISLSEAEFSVAASFISHISNISCVFKIIQEGRCALVTSFALFKYMALYSLIQFSSVLILLYYDSILGNIQFLYVDLIVTTSLAFLMGRTAPAKHLVEKRPSGSLVNASTIFSLFLQITLTFFGQISALLWLMSQSWYIPNHSSVNEDIVICWENTTIFCVSCFQYITISVAYSKGQPYRKPFYTNIWFLMTLFLLSFFSMLILIWPFEPLALFFELIPINDYYDHFKFRFILLIIIFSHLFTSIFVENYIVDSLWLKKCIQKIKRKDGPKKKFKRLDLETLASIDVRVATTSI